MPTVSDLNNSVPVLKALFSLGSPSVGLQQLKEESFFSPFPIHRTYFWVSPPQMALLGFFHVNSLFASPVHSRNTWIHRPTGIVRERSHMVGKEEEGRRKKPRKKTLRHNRDLNPRSLSPEPSMLSIRPRRPALKEESYWTTYLDAISGSIGVLTYLNLLDFVVASCCIFMYFPSSQVLKFIRLLWHEALIFKGFWDLHTLFPAPD